MSWQLEIGAQVTGAGVRFRVWAPTAERVDVAIYAPDGQTIAATHPLERRDEGYWQAEVAGLDAGTRYAFSVDGGEPRPDPASRSQPDGVHAPSAVVDPGAFAWSDATWQGVPLADMIVYEIHVGTATPKGTFDALIDKLPYLRELGVTALEIMPIADFPGCRNWGYDGVNLFAPANCYGGPEGFRRLVDAAHREGLAVVLDVVYNHFGPDGNYLRVFSPEYFTGRHHTPWGEAINLDAPGSPAVRRYLVDNALHWAHEYHLDGLRLDATHALIDDSPTHLLQELTQAVHDSLPPGRHFVIAAEDERNDPRLALPPSVGGYGLDAIWADDFHHEARIALTQEQSGYYADYSGMAEDLATAIRDGWFYQGQRSGVGGHPRGKSPRELEPPQFVYCIQNHDQVGNRPLGDRLHHAVGAAEYRALSALLLLAPQTPLLFQGQEWSASTPFLFFTDHNAELGQLITAGRRKEFEGFWRETHMEVPDPQAESSFARSKLRWDELEAPEHAGTLALYRELIRLRRTHPALQRRDRASYSVEVVPAFDAPARRAHGNATTGIVLRRSGAQPGAELVIVVNLVEMFERAINPLLGNIGHDVRVLLDTNDARFGGDATAELMTEPGRRVHLRMRQPGVVVLAGKGS